MININSSLTLNTIPNRILLATIRFLGKCPCPRCFVKKKHIGALGTKIDDQRRKQLRTDTEQRQSKVDQSRKWIFEDGKGINSTWVNNLLQEGSWIPNHVSLNALLVLFIN